MYSAPQVAANIALVKNLTLHGVFWGSYMQNNPKVLRQSLEEPLAWLSQGKLQVPVSHRWGSAWGLWCKIQACACMAMLPLTMSPFFSAPAPPQAWDWSVVQGEHLRTSSIMHVDCTMHDCHCSSYYLTDRDADYQCDCCLLQACSACRYARVTQQNTCAEQPL